MGEDGGAAGGAETEGRQVMHPGFIPRNHPNAVKKQGVDDSIDDRETPPCVFDPLNAEFRFTLDAAASHSNRKVDLYCTLGGLHANISGRVVTVHEEDEAGGRLSNLDWVHAPEGVWAVHEAPAESQEELAGAQAYLRLGSRRYTATHDGVPPVRQYGLREPAAPILGHELRQHEGLLKEGTTTRVSAPGGSQGEAEDNCAPRETGRELEEGARRTGLGISWAGHRVYINPPFSLLWPWVEKAWREPAEVVCMLLPNNRQEQPFWQDMVEPFRDRAGSILTTRFLRKRRPFLHMGQGIGNRTSKNPPFGLVVLIWDRRTPEPLKRT